MLGYSLIRKIIKITSKKSRLENSSEMRALREALDALRNEVRSSHEKRRIRTAPLLIECEHVPEDKRNGGQKIIARAPPVLGGLA